MAIDPATSESPQPRRPEKRGRGGKAGLLLIGALLLAAVAAAFLIDEDDGASQRQRDGSTALTGAQALLSGSVVDAKTKKPLPGARLVIDQEGGRLTVVTDAGGHYRRVINASRPIGFTADAAGHQGTAGFGKLCPGERRTLDLALPPAGGRTAPPAPLVIQEKCG